MNFGKRQRKRKLCQKRRKFKVGAEYTNKLILFSNIFTYILKEKNGLKIN
jgi:hypothetical protein